MVRPIRASLVELLDRLLDKGVVLDADVIITVADVPMAGLKLRAILAGATALKRYGLLGFSAEKEIADEHKGLASTEGSPQPAD